MYKNLAAALAAACFSFPAFSQTAPADAPPLKVGFVQVAPIGDAGWARACTAPRSRTCPKGLTPSA